MRRPPSATLHTAVTAPHTEQHPTHPPLTWVWKAISRTNLLQGLDRQLIVDVTKTDIVLNPRVFWAWTHRNTNSNLDSTTGIMSQVKSEVKSFQWNLSADTNTYTSYTDEGLSLPGQLFQTTHDKRIIPSLLDKSLEEHFSNNLVQLKNPFHSRPLLSLCSPLSASLQ